MKEDRMALKLQAIVFALLIYCMIGFYPISITAGEPEYYCVNELPLATVEVHPQEYCENYTAFKKIANDHEIENVDRLADLCVEKLNDESAVRIDPSGTYIETGIISDYETARNIYLRSREKYYGNIGYSMAYTREADGKVSLMLKPEYGTPKQAYEEHCLANAKITEIASQFTGSASEDARDIFQWVCDHVSYAGDETLQQIRNTPEGKIPNYNGIYATTYTAAIDGISTCDGYSGMLLALYEKVGIPVAKVQNSEHAYNIVFVDNTETIYDATNGLIGNACQTIAKYEKYYYPQTVTFGYSPLLENIFFD